MDGKKQLTIEVQDARNGEKYMTIRTAEGEVRLNSNYRPSDEAERWAKGVEHAQKGAIVMMFGLGSGYHLKALLNTLSDDAAVIVYEPSEAVYQAALNEFGMKAVLADSRVYLLVEGKNDREIYALLDMKIHWSNATKQCFLILPQYEKVFPESCAYFEQTVRNNNIRVYTNRNTEMHFGESIAKNVALNLQYVLEASNLAPYIGAFPEGLPAILVSAGPSLDKNIDLLKEAKGKAFIIAVDTALRTLHTHGILPDATATLDSMILEKYFENTDFDKLVVFAKPQANHVILEKNHAKKIWFDSHGYLSRFYESIGRKNPDYHAGASVATAAFSICAALGFKRIILIGQDLAYLGDVTHTGGEVMAIQAEEENIAYVESVDGGTVKTRHDWLQYLRWFERVVKEVEGEIEVIDATEGGALIHGTKLMTLREAVDRYCVTECDAEKLLNDLHKPLSVQEKEKFVAFVKKSINEAEELKSIAGKIVAACEEQEKRFAESAESVDLCVEELRKTVAQANAKIANMDFYLLADDATKKISIPAITEILESEEMSREEHFRILAAKNKEIYEALAVASADIAERMRGCLK